MKSSKSRLIDVMVHKLLLTLFSVCHLHKALKNSSCAAIRANSPTADGIYQLEIGSSSYSVSLVSVYLCRVTGI